MDQENTKDNIGKDCVDFRCSSCGKLLAQCDNDNLSLKIKCNRCGTINSIFQGVADQVIITDSEGVILYANPLVESMTGYSLSEVLGKKPSLWGGQMPQNFYKNMWRVLVVEQKPVLVNVLNKKKDGTLYNAKLQISPVFGLDNKIKMFVGVESFISFLEK